MDTQVKKRNTVYCHFSFKRPKGKAYGLFAVAFYRDFIGKQLIHHVTKRLELWKDHQFVTAIQSYGYALNCIYELQGMMKDANISQVMLVTDNSTLAGWIEYPKKSKAYLPYMEKAVKPYRTGSYKEIVIGVGLCEVRSSEKAYKYCKEDFAVNEYTSSDNSKQVGGYKIDIGEYKSAMDIVSEDKAVPSIIGLNLIE